MIEQSDVFDLTSIVGRIEQMHADVLMNRDPRIAYKEVHQMLQRKNARCRSLRLCESPTSLKVFCSLNFYHHPVRYNPRPVIMLRCLITSTRHKQTLTDIKTYSSTGTRKFLRVLDGRMKSKHFPCDRFWKSFCIVNSIGNNASRKEHDMRKARC